MHSGTSLLDPSSSTMDTRKMHHATAPHLSLMACIAARSWSKGTDLVSNRRSILTVARCGRGRWARCSLMKDSPHEWMQRVVRLGHSGMSDLNKWDATFTCTQ